MPDPPAACWRGVRLRGREGGTALAGFTLEVATGERLTLLGPAGAGKTAAVMLLAGFARPEAGVVLLAGQDMKEVPPHRRGLGVVFQDDVPLPHLTLAGNVAFPLVARGLPRAEQRDRVDWALRAFGLAGLGEHRPQALDAAQRVRAALARAVVARPRLLVLDAPFDGIPTADRAALLDHLEDAADAIRAAVVMTAADPADALATGGRVAVLRAGFLLQHGPAQAVYDSPASAPVARLLGEANLLPGTVEAVEHDIARVRLACGLVVEARARADVVPGQGCLVFVRPERVAVAASDAVDMGERALPAEATTLQPRGDHVRLTFRLGAEPARAMPLVVRRPAGGVPAGLAAGTRAAVAWQAHHAMVVPAEG